MILIVILQVMTVIILATAQHVPNISNVETYPLNQAPRNEPSLRRTRIEVYKWKLSEFGRCLINGLLT